MTSPLMDNRDSRLANEIKHGARIADNPGEVWNWESPAGKVRWQRRTIMLSQHIVPGMQVLELGCGTGYYTKELIDSGASVTAIDISPDLLALARHNVQCERINFLEANAYDLPFEDNSFDTVIGSSVLHHLDVEQALREVYRVLRPGGTAVFTEPNMLNPQIMLQKNIPYLKAKLGDSPDETAFFKWPLQRLLGSCGFTRITITPFDFLHPAIPAPLVPFVARLTESLEQIPLLREIAGSLYIQAEK